MIAPVGIAAIRATYGDIKVARVNGQLDIVLPKHWESANMRVVRDLPGFVGRPLYVHNLIADPLHHALAAATAACPDYRIRTMGCFCPRIKRGGSGDLSLHSWGIAVDINADTNPRGPTLVTDMPPAFIAAFTNLGWTWGGHFPTPDAMHFQFASGW